MSASPLEYTHWSADIGRGLPTSPSAYIKRFANVGRRQDDLPLAGVHRACDVGQRQAVDAKSYTHELWCVRIYWVTFVLTCKYLTLHERIRQVVLANEMQH